MFFPPITPPTLPGMPPVSLRRVVQGEDGINRVLIVAWDKVGGKRCRVHVYLPSWFIESCRLIMIYMQSFEKAAFRKLESSLTE